VTTTRPAGLAALDRFSAVLGRDPEQVQAAGGNTSLKDQGVLWVKASGLWLADAEVRDIFVPVRLDEVLEGVRNGLPDPVSGAVVAERNPNALRPSIETTLHALLPHPVVVHTHSVRTIALAVCEDGEALLAQRLDDLAWVWVPYRKPGLPLTRLVAERTAGRAIDVLVLGNHGLVVGGADVPAAEALLAEVERRLDGPAVLLPTADPTRLPAVPGLRPVRHARAHGLALRPDLARRIVRGSLYPDHVIFLGPAASVLGDRDDRGGKLFLAPGAGALLAAETSASADELALCLALVMQRVPPHARLRYLAPEDEAELLDWDAEKHRQALARFRDGCRSDQPVQEGVSESPALPASTARV
jgi:rhamnose utilization protein RhaD (predicted bifunctional aldolase and dehydrogenase)